MTLDPAALQRALRARLDYFRDLGIFDLYRRDAEPGGLSDSLQASGVQPAGAESIQQLPAQPAAWAQQRHAAGTPAHSRPDQPLFAPDAEADASLPITEEDQTIALRKAPLAPIAFTPGPLIAPAARAQVLEAVRQEIGDCTRCPLGFAGRHKIVFGDGDPNARLLFVGEGPGADEDMQGIPFVGRAGQLLNNMITAMGLKREQVYIANIVKCRPPKNRVPEPVEAITCSQFLLRQIDIIRPQVIVALRYEAACIPRTAPGLS